MHLNATSGRVKSPSGDLHRNWSLFVQNFVQGYLAHTKTPSTLGPPWDPRHRPTAGSWVVRFLANEVPLYATCPTLICDGPSGGKGLCRMGQQSRVGWPVQSRLLVAVSTSRRDVSGHPTQECFSILHGTVSLQGCLAHKKTPNPLGPP